MRVLPGWARYTLYSVLAVALLLASGIVVWRVLRPAEVVTAARTAYPAGSDVPAAGPIGALISAPLIVDGRIRVYAAKRQIWSDDQPDFRYEKSPFWSFRRWPQQLIGVVEADGTVVGSWSDGKLTALDARTGKVKWRADGIVLGDRYAGRRTGAATVWTPPGLLTGRSANGDPVVVTAGAGAAAFNLATGTPLWRKDGNGCGAQAFTGPGQLLVPDSCTDPQGLTRYDLASGSASQWAFHSLPSGVLMTPLGCRVGNSECGGLRLEQHAAQSQGWLLTNGGDIVSADTLAPAHAWLAGDVAVDAPLGDTTDTRALTGKDARTGANRWTWSPASGDDNTSVGVVAVADGRLFVLSRARTLIVVDQATGQELSRTPTALPQDPDRPYDLGLAYAAGPYFAVERLTPGVAPSATDDQYYYLPRPVLLAAGA
ncbi:outer membrane protein assembly factor BamB family protein [Hamadaea tsunoensis]|uniref:outer membrane protein assembly factor BamB family protein n=1 Tax=Hamadaea tsunoensis TaxID=53368 RepID=UPI0004846F41|nr:PQQ-binding-like beta-propeller repeat protein [Hamadaea tsunoensis]